MRRSQQFLPARRLPATLDKDFICAIEEAAGTKDFCGVQANVGHAALTIAHQTLVDH
jgi:hypothetical protein